MTLSAKSFQSCPTLCDPIDGSPPGSPVPGILQERTLEWVTISFSNAWKWKVKVKWLSRVRLHDPMDCSLPGSSIHGIFQARVLEWGAIAFSLTLSVSGETLKVAGAYFVVALALLPFTKMIFIDFPRAVWIVQTHFLVGVRLLYKWTFSFIMSQWSFCL